MAFFKGVIDLSESIISLFEPPRLKPANLYYIATCYGGCYCIDCEDAELASGGDYVSPVLIAHLQAQVIDHIASV